MQTPAESSIAETLARIDARLARLEAAAERVDAVAAEAPHAIAALGDTFDSIVNRLRAGGVEVDERARDLIRLLEQLSRPDNVAALGRLVDQLQALGDLAARAQLAGPTHHVLASAAEALNAAALAPSRQVGLFGALGAMGDADVQRALGVMLNFAAAFGRAIPEATRPLPTADAAAQLTTERRP